MNRRNFLTHVSALPLLRFLWPQLAWAARPAEEATVRRVRPSNPEWPSAESWEKLNRTVGGRQKRFHTLAASIE
jgi:hypothetical protein